MLRFRIFGIPVVLRLSFLLVAAFLGLTGARNRPSFVVAWVVLVFVSILIHELGHALTARAFGAEVDIELNGFGGLTHWTIPADGIPPGRRAVVAAAGSAVGILFGGVVWAVSGLFEPVTVLEAFVLRNLVWVNLFWGLLNWLPIRPLDGGHLLRSFLEKVAPTRAEAIARVVFTITAALVLMVAWRLRNIIIGALGVWLLFSEFAPSGPPAPSAGLPDLVYEDDPPQPDPAGPDQDSSQGG
ncbi:MAG: site-2 protease family protein [Acidimicrobiia bacterium]